MWVCVPKEGLCCGEILCCLESQDRAVGTMSFFPTTSVVQPTCSPHKWMVLCLSVGIFWQSSLNSFSQPEILERAWARTRIWCKLGTLNPFEQKETIVLDWHRVSSIGKRVQNQLEVLPKISKRTVRCPQFKTYITCAHILMTGYLHGSKTRQTQ